MRAVVLKGTSQVGVETVDDPRIERATGCIVQLRPGQAPAAP